MLVTNHPTIVECAKKCYAQYPTIVNALKESGITYTNSKKSYADMDNRFSNTRMGIGWSSNLAQLAMTYYWTELAKDNPDKVLLKKYYDIFVILSVVAQVQIDSSKREYEISGDEEIKRISKLPCMTLTQESDDGKTMRCDFPMFMKYTREIKLTKNGKDLSFEEINKSKNKLNRRINYDLECPMNWLQDWLNKIQNASCTDTVPTKDFFVKMSGKANDRQMSKIRRLVEVYDECIKYYAVSCDNSDAYFKMAKIANEVLECISKIKIGNIVTINRLIEVALGVESANNRAPHYKAMRKRTRATLNFLYKMDKDKFLLNFISGE